MSGPTSTSAVGALLVLADGRLPTGSHANGAGVEWAAAHDDLSDPVVLQSWIEARLQTSGTVAAAFAVAAGGADAAGLEVLDAELSARLVGPRAREVSRQMGRQLLRLATRAWPDRVGPAIASPDGPHAPLVFGSLCHDLDIGPVPTATLMLHHMIASAVTASVRLLAADPIELAALQVRCGPVVDRIASQAERWAVVPASELPAHSMPLAEVLAEDHGTWTSRLFVA